VLSIDISARKSRTAILCLARGVRNWPLGGYRRRGDGPTGLRLF
jgi:hypothetical protein